MKNKIIKCYNKINGCTNEVEMTEKELAEIGEGEVVICHDCFENLAEQLAAMRTETKVLH